MSEDTPSRIPIGVGPPVHYTIALSSDPAEVDFTQVTGIASMNVRKPDGSIVPWTGTFTPSPPLAVSGATAASPPVLTVPSTLIFVRNPSVTVAGVGGMTGLDGPFFVSILTPTTIALFLDADLTEPATGAGAYTTGGTVTPNAIATADHAFELGDVDLVGVYVVSTWLSVPGGTWPAKPSSFVGVSPFDDLDEAPPSSS